MEIAIDKILHNRRSITPPDGEDEDELIGSKYFFLDFFRCWIFTHFFHIFESEKVLFQFSRIEIEYFDSISFFFREGSESLCDFVSESYATRMRGDNKLVHKK